MEKSKNVKAWKEIIGNEKNRPDLIVCFQAEINELLYRHVVEKFNREHNCRVVFQRVPRKMLMEPLLDALEDGCDVPDMVELLEGTMCFFTDCPIEEVRLVDLTERLKEGGWLDPNKMVLSSYSTWSSRDRIFAIPKTVHPVALCYRVDLIEKLGIDVTKLRTWDDFVEAGQRLGGGYMIDMADDNMISMIILLTQRGFDLFDADGDVAFDKPEVAELIAWYVHQTRGKKRIAFSAGDGQNFYHAMNNGRILFFFTPDWRTRQFELENPTQKGNLALMPMPVWADKDGNRLPGSHATATWGGMGLAITKHCKNQELAWEFAKALYLEASDEDHAEYFRTTHIVPAVKNAWTVEDFNRTSPFYKEIVRDQNTGDLLVRPVSLGKFYASMADDTPPRFFSVYNAEAETHLMSIYYDACNYYEKHQDDENIDERLLELIGKQLKEKADLIRNNMKQTEKREK